MIRITLGFNEWQNIDLVKLLCKIMDEKLGRGWNFRTIDFLCKDRPGHDLRCN
jgi:dTDP-glucose 4,6-dehydratase